MSFDPTAYGLTPELTTANLLNGISAYKQAVEKLAGTATPTQALESATRAEILKDTLTNSIVGMLTENVRDTIFGALFEHPEMSVGLFESLEGIRKDVKEIRDWHVSKVAKNVRVEIPVDSSTDELRTAAENLGEYVSNVYSFFSSDAGKMFPGFNAEEFATVPTKTSEKTGNVSLSLPRVPGSRKGGSGNAGRGIVYRITQFEIDGDQLPEGTHLRDALMACSDSRYVFSVSWILDELKRTGQEMSAAPGTTWTVELPNGKSLTGYVPSDAVVSEDDDSEEDNDQ